MKRKPLIFFSSFFGFHCRAFLTLRIHFEFLNYEQCKVFFLLNFQPLSPSLSSMVMVQLKDMRLVIGSVSICY